MQSDIPPRSPEQDDADFPRIICRGPDGTLPPTNAEFVVGDRLNHDPGKITAVACHRSCAHGKMYCDTSHGQMAAGTTLTPLCYHYHLAAQRAASTKSTAA